ncbi:MAG: hypothetical protein JNL79_39370 [Myxococcales bacterium]|nr:hypothetical protein [Myxococcales bacterium]
MREPRLLVARKISCTIDPDGCYLRVFRHRVGDGIELRTLPTPLDGEREHQVHPAVVRLKPGVLVDIGPWDTTPPPERWRIVLGDVGTELGKLYEVVIEPWMLEEVYLTTHPQYSEMELEAHVDSEKMANLFWAAIADFAARTTSD